MTCHLLKMQNLNIIHTKKQAKVTYPNPTPSPCLKRKYKTEKDHLPPLPEPAHLSARVVGWLQWWDNRNLEEQDHSIFHQQDQELWKCVITDE